MRDIRGCGPRERPGGSSGFPTLLFFAHSPDCPPLGTPAMPHRQHLLRPPPPRRSSPHQSLRDRSPNGVKPTLLTESAARCIHLERVNAEAPVPIRTDLLTTQRFPGLMAQETAPLQHHHSRGSRGRINRPVEEPRHARSMPEALHPGPTVRAQASVNTNHRGRCVGAYLDSATRAPVGVSSRAMLGRAKRRGALERGRRQLGEACPSSK